MLININYPRGFEFAASVAILVTVAGMGFAQGGAAAETASRPAKNAVRAELLYTSAGAPIRDGVILIKNGKIDQIGRAADINIPPDFTITSAAVATPGLIDAHTCAGLSGYLNQPHDQDQLERSSPIQPELRAIDAYNSEEKLIEWIRGLGVTTIHTGHGPGALVSGQTMIVKTAGRIDDSTILRREAMVAATLGDSAISEKSPGTRAKAMALIREELIRAQSYKKKSADPDESKRPERNLRLETLARVLDGSMPLLVTAQRHQDISAALRLAREFSLRLVLDGAADALFLLEELRTSGVPVILHPAMQRAGGENENQTFESAARLRDAGIRFAFQSGFEGYVPKNRVVLFEAAIAAAHGLGAEPALRAVTIDAARLLGIEERVGSLEIGKDADIALYDGDPLEYTTHCVGVFINGVPVSQKSR